MMPGMDGLQFATKVKELYFELMKPCPRIILCSADYSSSLAAKCENAGVARKSLQHLLCFVSNCSLLKTVRICYFSIIDMLRKPVTLSDLNRSVNGKKQKQQGAKAA